MEFIQSYESKSSIELLMIYKSDEFQDAAKNAAKSILEERLGGTLDFESAWQNEIQQLETRSNRCHKCSADKIAYESEEFVFRRSDVEINWGAVATGLFIGLSFGHRNASTNDSPRLRLRLCSACYPEEDVSQDDYFEHPFYELYELLGYHDVVQVEKTHEDMPHVLDYTTGENIEQQDAELVDQAAQYIGEGELDKAVKVLKGVISRTPESYVNEFEQDGKLFIKFWDQSEFMSYSTWHQAFNPSQDLIGLKNAYPRAFFYYGYVLVETKEYEAALQLLDMALSLQPGCPKLLNEKAQVLLRMGAHEKARDIFEQVLSNEGFVDPSDWEVSFRGKGYCQIEQGDLDAAGQTFLESLRRDSTSGVAKQELDHIRFLRSSETEATQIGINEDTFMLIYDAWEAVLSKSKKQSNWIEEVEELARSVGALTDEEQRLARTDFHQAVVNCVKISSAVKNLKDTSKSKALLDTLNDAEHVAEHFFGLGRTQYKQGELDEAFTNFMKCIELNGDNARYHSYIGLVLRGKKNFDLAIAAFEKSLEVQQDYAPTHLFLGSTFAEVGRFDEAISYCRKAIELDPTLAGPAHYRMGRVFQALGRADEAIRELEESKRAGYFEYAEEVEGIKL